MKILFAIKTIDGSKGGAEKVLADISSGLSERGHHVEVLSFDSTRGKSFYNFGKKVKKIRLGVGDISRKATFWEVITRMRVIRKLVKRHKPDVVIAFMHSSFIPCSFALVGTGVPIIASEHIVPAHYKKRKWEFFLLCLSRFFVKKITVLSETIIRTYPSFLQLKMIAIANPVNAQDKYAKLDTGNKKVILNVGRMTEQKNQKILIQAFSLIHEKYPDWVVRFVGEGELYEDLKQLAKDLNLEEKVIFAGTTSNIDEEYQNADIFALPSKYESFGLATAEAMSHGLPSLGFTECPGTNEIIQHQSNGLLAEGLESVRHFSQNLEKLMISDELRATLGKQAKESVKKFAPDQILNQWEDLIKKCTLKN